MIVEPEADEGVGLGVALVLGTQLDEGAGRGPVEARDLEAEDIGLVLDAPAESVAQRLRQEGDETDPGDEERDRSEIAHLAEAPARPETRDHAPQALIE